MRVDLNQSGVGTLAGHAVDNGQNINFLKLLLQ